MQDKIPASKLVFLSVAVAATFMAAHSANANTLTMAAPQEKTLSCLNSMKAIEQIKSGRITQDVESLTTEQISTDASIILNDLDNLFTENRHSNQKYLLIEYFSSFYDPIFTAARKVTSGQTVAGQNSKNNAIDEAHTMLYGTNSIGTKISELHKQLDTSALFQKKKRIEKIKSVADEIAACKRAISVCKIHIPKILIQLNSDFISLNILISVFTDQIHILEQVQLGLMSGTGSSKDDLQDIIKSKTKELRTTVEVLKEMRGLTDKMIGKLHQVQTDAALTQEEELKRAVIKAATENIDIGTTIAGSSAHELNIEKTHSAEDFDVESLSLTLGNIDDYNKLIPGDTADSRHINEKLLTLRGSLPEKNVTEKDLRDSGPFYEYRSENFPGKRFEDGFIEGYFHAYDIKHIVSKDNFKKLFWQVRLGSYGVYNFDLVMEYIYDKLKQDESVIVFSKDLPILIDSINDLNEKQKEKFVLNAIKKYPMLTKVLHRYGSEDVKKIINKSPEAKFANTEAALKEIKKILSDPNKIEEVKLGEVAAQVLKIQGLTQAQFIELAKKLPNPDINPLHGNKDLVYNIISSIEVAAKVKQVHYSWPRWYEWDNGTTNLSYSLILLSVALNKVSATSFASVEWKNQVHDVMNRHLYPYSKKNSIFTANLTIFEDSDSEIQKAQLLLLNLYFDDLIERKK